MGAHMWQRTNMLAVQTHMIQHTTLAAWMVFDALKVSHRAYSSGTTPHQTTTSQQQGFNQ